MKKLISVLLSLVLVLTFCIPAVHADTPAEEESYSKLYAPAVKQIIDTNLVYKDTNEEFFHLLADLYLTNPAALAEIISEYPDDDILYLIKAISYRTKIMIHGGRHGWNTDESSPYHPLWPTNGCIRIENDYQNQITNEIQDLINNGHSYMGYVIVTQNGLTDL